MEQFSRMSVAGVVASTAGSLIAATTVFATAGLALANPPGSNARPSTSESRRAPLPTGLPGSGRDLDLPVMRPTNVSQDDGIDVPQVDGKDKRRWQLNPGVLPPAAPPPAPGGDATDPVDVPEGPNPTFFGEVVEVTGNSVIYVIDNSGSMSMYVDSFVDENGQVVNGTRLDRAKAELRRSISQLPENYHFNVLFYDECVMSCWTNKQQASAENKAASFNWINNVQPDGWTNTGLGVVTALGDKSNTTVVLLSDGAPNFMDCAMNYVGTYDQHRDLINTQNTQGARVNCFGIGIATDVDARSFLQSVAGDTGGTYVDIN